MVPRHGSFSDSLRHGAIASGRPLLDSEVVSLEAHYRLLVKWNKRMNLTGLKDEGAIVRRHFLEPIAASAFVGDAGTLVDLGSGNGFPAIPLKVLHPGLDLVLVESSEKKSAFLWAVLRELGLSGSRVATRRVRNRRDLEGLAPCRYLTVRGIRVRELLVGGEGSILEPGGRALLFVSDEEAKALKAMKIKGMHWNQAVSLPSGSGSVMVILEA
jgi:16S rRNA (guanine527-N7)-methyltransferase